MLRCFLQIIACIIIVCVVCVVYFWIYPYLISFYPKTYNVGATSMNVSNNYFTIPYDGIKNLSSSNGKIIGTCYDVLFRPKQKTIKRKLPNGFSNINTLDTSWQLRETIHKLEGTNIRTFIHTSNNDSIQIVFPALNDDPSFVSYRGNIDTILIVLGSCNWKRTETQFGYILAWKKKN